MKKLTLFVSLLMLVFFSCGKKPVDFQGLWQAKDDPVIGAFSLLILEREGVYEGTYSVIRPDAAHIELSTEEAVSFRFTKTNSQEIETAFTSYASGKTGKIGLKVTGDKLEWTMTQKPEGPCLLPDKAELTRKKLSY